MFPIGDDNSDRERWPFVTVAFIALNVLVFLYELYLENSAPRDLLLLIHGWAVVPLEYSTGEDLPPEIGLPFFATLVTSMFLHGGWGHLLGNALYLWVFGNNVEDSMGRWRFLAFYLLCGIAAAAAHVVIDPASPVPTVGASGAISGVLGGYLLLYPRVRVRTFFPPLFLFHVPAWFVLVFWFAGQVLSGLPQLNTVDPNASGGVAVWAHIGGFVAGVLLVKLFEDRAFVRRRTAVGDAHAVWDPR
jgi:membrane associated rhomboid family serine protease